MFIRARLSAAALGLLAVTLSSGQAITRLAPTKVLTGAPVSRLDTASFVIPIDESFNYQPIWPENPIDRVEAKSKWNTLPVGRTLTSSRGKLDELFPAIGATGWNPPDPDLAVGQNHILATVNSSIAWFDKQGNKQFQQTAQSFFSGMGTGTFIFDPKCFYDRANQRYVLLFLEKDNATQVSKLLLALSDDGDPNGTWYRYRLESKAVVGGNPCWLDYPGFGYNQDAYVVSGNMFGFVSGFGGAQFVVIPTADILSGGPADATSFIDTGSSSVQIAEMIGDMPNIYAASRNGSSGVKIFSINDPSGSPSIQSASVTVPSNSGPTTDAQSTGGMLDTVDGRVYNVTWRAGKLVMAHNIQDGSVISSRWYEVATNGFPGGAPTLGQSGNISSGGMNYFCPAISLNAEGSISALFSGSNSSVTANLLFAARSASDQPGAMGAPQVLATSEGSAYAGRWGDYFGVDVDPTDDTTFWGIGTIVSATNGWQTTVFSWTVSGTPPPPPPPPTDAELASLSLSPTSVRGGTPATATVTLTAAAPSEGAVIQITSNSAYATVSGSVTVPAGQTSATFTVSTTRPNKNVSATISASYRNVTKSASLTIRRK